MRVLVIIGNFYPNPSSVANCARPLLDELGEQYNVIDIISNVPLGKWRRVKYQKISTSMVFRINIHIMFIKSIVIFKKYNTIIYRSIRRLVKVPCICDINYSVQKKWGMVDFKKLEVV